MAGGDLTWSQPKFQFNAQYLYREDKNPYFLIAEAEKIQTRGGFAELLYIPHGDDSRWYTVALFNWVDSDQPDLDYTSAGLHYGYLYEEMSGRRLKLPMFLRVIYPSTCGSVWD